ncbi:MAG: hypothetical protein ACLTQI_07480 [Slackia sp.]
MGVVIPRITLRADYGEENSFGELSLLCIGYGLHQAWVFATMFSPQRIFGVSVMPVSDFLGSNVSVSPMMAASVVVYALFLMFAGATDQRYLNFYTSRRFSVIGAALMVMGTLAALLSGSAFLGIVAGVLTGLGSAALILSWGIAFARCDGLSIVLDTAVATVFAMALYAFVIHNAPVGVAGFVVAALPLLELAALRCKPPTPFYERGELPAFNPLPSKGSIPACLLRAGCLAGLCARGVAFCLCRQSFLLLRLGPNSPFCLRLKRCVSSARVCVSI